MAEPTPESKPPQDGEENQQAPPGQGEQKAAEGSDQDVISLEDLDEILADEDPDLASSLGDIKDEGDEEKVEIESALGDEAMSVDSDFDDGQSRWLSRFPRLAKLLKPLGKPWNWLRGFLFRRWIFLRSRSVSAFRSSLMWVKTQPKEYWNYSRVQMKALKGLLKESWLSLKELSWFKKVMILLTFVAIGVAGFVLSLNLSGYWLPVFNKPLLASFSDVASQVYEYDPKEGVMAFHRAFPQPEFEVLMDKIVVNLKRTTRHRNPMGAFEFFVSADSKDTAIEIKSREVELLDLTQRAIETQTYTELNGPRGQLRLKRLIKNELNKTLTSGWVKEVYIKTLILKP